MRSVERTPSSSDELVALVFPPGSLMENSTSTGTDDEIDAVELAVTCVAAVLIMTAIGILLYYFCTTPRQRERYCRRCKKTQLVEQNPTSPTS